jgi:hypothetical protein
MGEQSQVSMWLDGKVLRMCAHLQKFLKFYFVSFSQNCCKYFHYCVLDWHQEQEVLVVVYLQCNICDWRGSYLMSFFTISMVLSVLGGYVDLVDIKSKKFCVIGNKYISREISVWLRI